MIKIYMWQNIWYIMICQYVWCCKQCYVSIEVEACGILWHFHFIAFASYLHVLPLAASCFGKIDVDHLSKWGEIQWLRKSHAICACLKESVPWRTWAVTNGKTSEKCWISKCRGGRHQQDTPQGWGLSPVGTLSSHQEAEWYKKHKSCTHGTMLSLQLKVHIAVGIMRIKDLATQSPRSLSLVCRCLLPYQQP